MSRSSRRSSTWSWRIGLPAALGLLVLLALLASTLVVFVVYSDELKHPDGAEHHLQERLRLLFARQSYPSSEASLGKASSHDEKNREKFSMEDRSTAVAAAAPFAVVTAPNRAEEQAAKIQQQAAAADVEGDRKGAAAAVDSVQTTANGSNSISWKLHEGKSCQNYADDDTRERSLTDAKAACRANEACVAIECPHGKESYCTLRAIANLVDYAPSDCYEQIEMNNEGVIFTNRVHPAYESLLKEYPFQAVTSQTGNRVNIILVRSQASRHQQELYQKYKDEILFLGISSMNDYPLKEEGSADKTDYLGMYPGFLHMMREPEKHFPPHVKTLLMSQSDFSLPDAPPRDYSVPKKYDFTYSASDCDVASDGKGWCGWSKNWSFVKEALVMMCGEFNLKGVLVATKDKSGTKAYSIPESCKGKMIQTTYLARQSDYFDYLKQSKFAFLPQMHDASPRVSSQALAHDVPILMNWHILGGWKYVNDKTGEFFHDMSDFRQSLEKILKNSDIQGRYEPRKWVLENYGNPHSGKRLLDFVRKHFSHRVHLPKGTKLLLP